MFINFILWSGDFLAHSLVRHAWKFELPHLYFLSYFYFCLHFQQDIVETVDKQTDRSFLPLHLQEHSSQLNETMDRIDFFQKSIEREEKQKLY